jgi:hypothetical protein
VEVTLESGGIVDAVAMWGGGEEKLSSEEWDFEVSKREKLQDWLACFEGMEFI